MNRINFRVTSIHGAPRSGTSWLGQIFNSHPDVAYRYQPLFSHRFKGAIGNDSSHVEVERFLSDLYGIRNDEFILQTRQRLSGAHPDGFFKNPNSSMLVMKEVRYHYVIDTLLRQVEEVRIVGIVRHPCSVINSWLKTPREFKLGWDAMGEWRDAPSKNQGRPEEYFGFTKWKELALLFLSLESRYPERFRLVRYETLVESPRDEILKLFKFCGIDLHPQTERFLVASQASEVEDPDSVFRRPEVAGRWKHELSPEIREAILTDVSSSPLRVFL